MENLNEKIRKARDERETGDANKALEMFLEINKNDLELSQLFDYLGELGLTYWHLQKFPEAKEIFEEVKEKAENEGDNSHLAVALRHLSRPEFNKDNPSKSIDLSKQARQLAFNSKREDIAWFDHGVITSLIFNNSELEELKEWFDTEAKDLYEVSQKTKDEIAKWVWTTGLLIDRAAVFNNIGDLYLAHMIAENFNLKIRKEQIEKLIAKSNP